jgi:V8-like Glu-specific endopeptidase
VHIRFAPLLIGAGLLVFPGCAAETDEPAPAPDDEAAIVGNTIVDNEHPEVVALSVSKDGKTFVCTGTVVGDHTVITARHCIDGAVDATGCHIAAVVDRLGQSSRGPGVDRYTAKECAVMPMTLTYRSDLGLIRLDRSVTGIVPARLADSSTPRGSYTAYGYGSFGNPLGAACDSRSDGHKRKASYKGALGLRFGQVTCKGDSGGPHFAGTSNVIAGVTSAGAGAFGVNLDMNVDVADTRAWIVRTMASFSDAPK